MAVFDTPRGGKSWGSGSHNYIVLICYDVYMERTQILLTDEQAAELRERARTEGQSLASLVRRAVDRFLGQAEKGGDREETKRRALAAVGRFRSGVRDLATRHDDYLDDAYGR